MTMLSYGSLFAGIGGFDLAFDRAGMRCAWQVETDNRCNQVLRRHWPAVARYGDVRDVGKRNLEPVDVIVGGFPCQDLSVAGRRAGLAGERSGLWWEFHRIIAELNPQWVVVENVPGLLSSNGGRDMGTLLWSLGELRYGWAYRSLDAQYDGLAQRRKRVFIVGCLGDRTGAAKILFESESLPGHPPPGREAGQETTTTTVHCFRNSGRDTDQRSGRTGIGLEKELSYSLQAEQQHSVLAFPGMAQAGAGWAPPSMPIDEDRSGPLDTKRAQCVAFDWQGGGGVRLNVHDERTSALQSSQVPAVMAIQHSIIGRKPEAGAQGKGWRDDGRSWTLDSRGAADAVAGPFGVRRLTPTECERLQGFPDGHTAWGIDEDGNRVKIPDSPRYRMLGNAVAVPVAEWIGKRLLKTAPAPS